MDLGLDLRAGSKLALAEMYGDWYRDPWGWPEFQWLAQKPDRFDIGAYMRRDEGGEHRLAVVPAYHLLEVPKSRLAFRPAVVQDSLSRLAYASAVASNLEKLHYDLPDWVFGWRHRNGQGRVRNVDEWKTYLLHTADWMFNDHFALQVDIRSFFASIDVDRMADLLYERLGRKAAVSVIVQILRAHDNLTTRSGIPQRSFASAALAHFYLRPIDDALETALKSGAAGAARWMDDIAAVGSEDKMYRLFLDLRDRVRQIGLSLNDSKSRLVSADEAAVSIYREGLREINVPSRRLGSDYTGEEVIEYDTKDLLELEQRILSAPSQTPRTTLRAVLTSLRRWREWSRWRKWLEIAHEIPHAADSVGRYLRAAIREGSILSAQRRNWEEVAAWFHDYCGRE